MLFYLTNIAGIGAAVAGTILLVGQLLNGVTDLLVGVFIDKTKTRWGKTRPWILVTAIPMGLSLVLLFSVPSGFSETGKIAWAFIMYALLMAVFFTASNIAYSALLAVLTPSPKTRVTLTTFRFFMALLTTLIVSSITLPLIQTLGNDQHAWTSLTSIYGIIAAVTLLIVFFGTKERVVTAATAADAEPEQPLGTRLKNLFHNRYFVLAGLLFIAFYLLSGLAQGSGVYYATNILGDASLFSILSIATILPSLIGISFMPAIMGRYGKRPIFLIGLGIMLIGSLLPLFGPHSFELILISQLIRGVGQIPLTAGLFAIVADVVDYSEWKHGVRSDGLIYSAAIFGQKVGGGFGAAAVGWLLSWGAYDAKVVHQSAAANQAIFGAYIYLPIALIVVVGIIVYFFRIEQYTPQVQAFLRKKREQTQAAS
ncbi:GPH family glycoside/pentoside/hexuronide:cation symporter [Kibdelosporangium banguiense]|uniref:GPH family glycoside/pentoside/hexuronide:cation symporter n=1 Tax=Kibdelosporangium banguiense TaxID=1365924 RepID=A0ABS4TX21_9PSEU|nr:GPH family glycoside/pentoside/hexuronide:cation symporter [Kibdelosporangium banguiense]